MAKKNNKMDWEGLGELMAYVIIGAILAIAVRNCKNCSNTSNTDDADTTSVSTSDYGQDYNYDNKSHSNHKLYI